MTFVEFTIAEGTQLGRVGEKMYFVGKDWPSIFADTKGGTDFGFVKLSSHRILTEDEMRQIAKKRNFKFLEAGIQGVHNGRCVSYMIG